MANVGYVNKKVQAMYGIPYNQLTDEQKAIPHADSKRRAKLIKEREEAVLKNNLKAFQDEAKMEKVLASIYKNTQKQILADVAETIAKVKKAGGTWSYANQSALTRSRGLFEQITAELNKLGQQEQEVFTQGLSNIYTDQFLRQVYELGQTIPVKANFNRLNPALVKKTLDYPWSGAMFSDRIWLDKETLGKNLRVGLTQSMILGEGIPEITDRINKGIDTSRYNAERLARTETKRVTYVAHNDAYEDMGVDKLRYRVANGGDHRVCKVCMGDNNKEYKRGEEPTLPRHPNCRCVYIPVVSDEFGENELNELTNSVRGAENYEKWRKAEEEKLKKEKLLTPEQKLYNDTIEKLELEKSTLDNELVNYQNSYSNVTKDLNKLSVVKRGLATPEDLGFADMQEFTDAYNKTFTNQQGLQDQIKKVKIAIEDVGRDINFVQNSPRGVKDLESYKKIRNSLKDNTTFDYDKYADELLELCKRMDEDDLAINASLAPFMKTNTYNSKNGEASCHYSKINKSVYMVMNENNHEKALGNGLKGNWQTKWHEEGHQLDHLLHSVKQFGEVVDASAQHSRYLTSFTNCGTVSGKLMSEAIEKDIVKFMNDAIDYCNSNHNTNFKSVSKVGSRISSDTKTAVETYYLSLTGNGTDSKLRCQFSMFLDAMGLYTEDRLSRNTFTAGGWGHSTAYNKARGKAGANSETWATFKAIKSCGATEEVDFAQNLMPNTWSCMDTIYKEVAKYVTNNTLKY
jgi:SPP1 gp7 family putative phage head morphogenesis protein